MWILLFLLVIGITIFIYVKYSSKDRTNKLYKQDNSPNNTGIIKNREKIETFTINIDTEKLLINLDKVQKRRAALLKNPPPSLSEDSIKTVDIKKDYKKYFITGTVGADTVEACINPHHKSTIINFYVNGSALDTPDSHHPSFNIKTGELKIVFQENCFMEDAIKKWLIDEYNKVKSGQYS